MRSGDKQASLVLLWSTKVKVQMENTAAFKEKVADVYFKLRKSGLKAIKWTSHKKANLVRK